MATLEKRLYTIADYEAFIALPENDDKLFEFIDGEIVELVSNSVSSHIAYIIGVYLGIYLLQHELGYVTAADGGYQVGKQRYLPDLGYFSKEKSPKFPNETYIPIVPDLVVEVISPTDRAKQVANKITNYLAAGVIVWAIYPGDKSVVIHVPGQPALPIESEGSIDGGTLLPGFSLALQNIFKDLQ